MLGMRLGGNASAKHSVTKQRLVRQCLPLLLAEYEARAARIRFDLRAGRRYSLPSFLAVRPPMKIRSILFCALVALPMSVFASSFAGTSAGSATGASSNSSGSSSGDDKVVLEAREDAAGFVASNGAIRGAWLEAALIHLREKDVAARDASDMELARKILAL